MTRKVLKYGALIISLSLPLAACMQSAPSNPVQAEYLSDMRPCQPGTHSESFPTQQGYRCVLNQ
jgi:hypothetical protein